MGPLSTSRLRPVLPAALALLLGACTAWPPPGRGGAAERGQQGIATEGATLALAERLGCARARLAGLRAVAADRQLLAGQVATAEETAARARRELHGGLTRDAALSLDRLEAETAAISAGLPGPLPGLAPRCD